MGRHGRGHADAPGRGLVPATRIRQELGQPALIDAHAHLTDGRFADDLDVVLERSSSAGVSAILTCGDDLESSERALALCARDTRIRAAIGIHPHEAAGCDVPALARLRELAAHERVVAIGEIGVDRSGRSAPWVAQQQAFSAQLALAADLGLPVVVHVRDAGAEARALVDAGPPVRGQLHCFSEGPDAVDAWIARGFWLSFAGTLTFKANGHLREAARRAPLDRLLVETDAPYLAAEPHRGRRNEPALVRATYRELARLRGLALDELVPQLAANAQALFGARWNPIGVADVLGA